MDGVSPDVRSVDLADVERVRVIYGNCRILYRLQTEVKRRAGEGRLGKMRVKRVGFVADRTLMVFTKKR